MGYYRVNEGFLIQVGSLQVDSRPTQLSKDLEHSYCVGNSFGGALADWGFDIILAYDLTKKEATEFISFICNCFNSGTLVVTSEDWNKHLEEYRNKE